MSLLVEGLDRPHASGLTPSVRPITTPSRLLAWLKPKARRETDRHRTEAKTCQQELSNRRFHYLAYQRADGATWFGAEVDVDGSENIDGEWRWALITAVKRDLIFRADHEVKVIGWSEYSHLLDREESNYMKAYDFFLLTNRARGLDEADLKHLAHLHAHDWVRQTEDLLRDAKGYGHTSVLAAY
ncbi:uncharacterized protein LOC62_04G006487 [Vanrija pseudolonga]|uniref:Uncharacterized protein n=1 Tax=Vanrija pseudolonga TaxID=143232 RepID=A0AAF1BJ48_9TREE|nr:hypothetical protein LOC62_04G006487 [Vanrija pseudolonga]